MEPDEVFSTGPRLRVSDIAEMTGLSPRYWQRQIQAGVVPGCIRVKTGRRAIFMIDPAKFGPWWAQQIQEIKPCENQPSPAISSGAVKRSTRGSRGRGKSTRGLSKQQTLELLRNALKPSATS